MAKARKHRFSIEGKPLYPHLKITSERFPRVLATRVIEDDGAEYFGAFLNRTSARILMDFVNRTFRLRSCEIAIDGSFNYPCTMYYKRRCVAPCVAELCDEEEYAERVRLVRLFLRNDRELLREVSRRKIETAAEDLDFEGASKLRDRLQEIEDYWENTRVSPWTENTSDTFEVRYSTAGIDIFLVSQRARRVLGERVFSFPEATDADAGDALADVIEQFYRFHAPKEIRVSIDFERRNQVQKMVSEKFGRKVPISLVTDKNRKVSTEVAVFKSTTELDLGRLVVRPSAAEVRRDIGKLFKIAKPPKRISAVDVSHISGTNQVAAAIAWENGLSVPDAAEYLLTDLASEPAALAELIKERYSNDARDEIVLVDGGVSQMNAAASVLPSGSGVVLIGVVKPQGEHSEVSHFLTTNGRRIEFDPTSAAMNLLKRLRDEAHEFANAVHRETRDYAPFYEMANILPSLTEPERQLLLRGIGSSARVGKASTAQIENILGPERTGLAVRDILRHREGRHPMIKPLVVPIRFQDVNGAADDLRLINSPSGKASRPR
jgi:excinuclease ABC subunit C